MKSLITLYFVVEKEFDFKKTKRRKNVSLYSEDYYLRNPSSFTIARYRKTSVLIK